jgi:type I restriction enzyme M protein
MTSTQQRAALQRQIWTIANDVRGSVDGWDFKQYVLGTLFYRFISENFALYIEADDDSIHYAELSDEVVTSDIKDDAIKTKGYFIYPSQLFANVAKNANSNESLNTDLAATFAAIEVSASGYPSEGDIKGLFADFDTTSNRLGNTVKDKNLRLAAVLKGVAGLDFGHDFYEKSDAAQIDLFGDAYEFLISNYAANAGKSGGEFFTPQHVSKLIAQLAMHKQTSVNKIYDPACGSGSLLLQAKKHFDNHIIEDGFWGQELNHTTYNLARMNMFLHNINYDKFNIQLGDTLRNPHFGDDKPFDAIVSNPPYSVKWIGSDDPTLINDDRFAPAGVLAPKSKADFAFVLHALSYLSSKGRAAIVCFPSIFYRGGVEQKIRQYLVDNNYVETVISLAPNLFFGTTIAVNILVLSKHKTDTTTQFIDASGLFKKETNNNVLTDNNDEKNPGHIQQIMQIFDSKADTEYFAKSVSAEAIATNNYNLSVGAYVETKDTREVVDITQLNAKLKTTIAKVDQLRADVDATVAEIGDMGIEDFLQKLLDGVEVEWKALGKVVKTVTAPAKLKKEAYRLTGKVPIIDQGLEFITGYTDENVKAVTSDEYVIFGDHSEHIKYVDFAFIQGADGLKILRPISDNAKYIYYTFQNFYQKELNYKRHWSTAKETLIPIPCPDSPEKSLEIQVEIVRILDAFTELTAELTAEFTARNKQYNYYRHSLLNFPKVEA